jgi:hypothetical protein
MRSLLLTCGMALWGCGEICEDRAGFVTCGYCDQDRVFTQNPHAGMCRYCKSGTSCSGDVCGSLSCVPTTEKASINRGSDSSGCPGGTAPCGEGYCMTSGNVCCASVGLPQLSCAAGLACTAAATCVAPSGGGGGGGAACGTCTGNLQCSGWMSGTTCDWQSCACYFIDDHGSDELDGFYHSSDGQCFHCPEPGESCTQAAQGLINHCYQ